VRAERDREQKTERRDNQTRTNLALYLKQQDQLGHLLHRRTLRAHLLLQPNTAAAAASRRCRHRPRVQPPRSTLPATGGPRVHPPRSLGRRSSCGGVAERRGAGGGSGREWGGGDERERRHGLRYFHESRSRFYRGTWARRGRRVQNGRGDCAGSLAETPAPHAHGPNRHGVIQISKK
jgi:hypothetical protein